MSAENSISDVVADVTDPAAVEQTVEAIEAPVVSTLDWFAANWEGLLVGSLIAIGLTGLMLILRSVGRAHRKRTQDRTSWTGIIAGVFAKTTILFMLILAFDVVVNQTEVPRFIDRFFDTALVIAITLQAAIWVRELVLGVVKSRAALEEDDPDSTIGNALSIIRVLVNVAVFAIAALIILSNLGVNVLPLITGLGIGGIAIGLAAQGIFEDLFAALSIVFDRPFRRGDTINYGGAAGTFGTVEKIGLKTTRLRAVSGEQVIIGNTQLLGQEVTNIALAERRRMEIPFGVIYQTSPEKLSQIKAIVESTILDNEAIQPVRTICTGFGDSSIDFIFIYDHYSTDYDEIVGTKSRILIEITRLFSEHGIEFAYPTQTTFTSAPDGTMIMPYPEGFGAMFADAGDNDTKVVAAPDAKVTVTPKSKPDDIAAEAPGSSDVGPGGGEGGDE
ncbi:mechanosensitive ion channel family protein [Sphingomicrobium sediminis]|uniref:Mechanosensitive ion channel family protein n=1 Tax=Sphingomicrobium sediminis TaxID=2950949 RepID=A0A9X2EJL3_9SPHN|nr:mechanosensitive ion channel domain-containing protein [Sphingomicrobium sediminis]MCM8556472.1 mechanosensitive ion channel family protein [Sphingomicrobium sediminis]